MSKYKYRPEAPRQNPLDDQKNEEQDGKIDLWQWIPFRGVWA
jgi:hypothetical protein